MAIQQRAPGSFIDEATGNTGATYQEVAAKNQQGLRNNAQVQPYQPGRPDVGASMEAYNRGKSDLGTRGVGGAAEGRPVQGRTPTPGYHSGSSLRDDIARHIDSFDDFVDPLNLLMVEPGANVRAINNGGSTRDQIVRQANIFTQPLLRGPIGSLQVPGAASVSRVINPGGEVLADTQDELVDQYAGGSGYYGRDVPFGIGGGDPNGRPNDASATGQSARNAINRIPGAVENLVNDTGRVLQDAGRQTRDFLQDNNLINTDPTQPVVPRPQAPQLGGGGTPGSGGVGNIAQPYRPSPGTAAPSNVAQSVPQRTAPQYSSSVGSYTPQGYQGQGYTPQQFQGQYVPQADNTPDYQRAQLPPGYTPQQAQQVQLATQRADAAIAELENTRGQFQVELQKLSEFDPFGAQAFLQKATDRAVSQASGTAASARGGGAAIAGAHRQASGIQSQLTSRGIQEMEEARVRDAVQAAGLRGQAIQGMGQLDASRLSTEGTLAGLDVSAQTANQGAETAREGFRAQDINSQRQAAVQQEATSQADTASRRAASTAREGFRASDIASQRQAHTALEGLKQSEIASIRQAATQLEGYRASDIISQRQTELGRQQLTQQDINSLRQLDAAMANVQQSDINSLRQMEAALAQVDQQRYATDVGYQQSVDDNLMKQYATDSMYAATMEQIVRGGQFSGKDLVNATLEAARAALFAVSDQRQKQSIAPASKRDVLAFAKTGKGSFYEYKDPKLSGARPGQQFSGMAQDLERTKIGRTIVDQGPDGVKRVNVIRLAMADHAALAALAEDIAFLKKGKRAKRVKRKKESN